MSKALATYQTLFYLLLFWLSANSVQAQSSVLLQTVSMQFHQERLGDALKDISNTYHIHFSYSKDLIPINQRVTIKIEDTSLDEALRLLFDGTLVVFANIGDQIVLNADKNKPIRQGQKRRDTELYGSISLPQAKPLTNSAPQIHALPPDPFESKPPDFEAQLKQQWELARLESQSIEYAEASIDPMGIPLEFEISKSGIPRRAWQQRLAQVSLLPYVGTNLLKSAAVENVLSVNILGGRNGGVNGVELGGFINNVKYDVRGVQIAGFGNVVGGEMEGTQIAGLANYNKGVAYGMQAAGLANFAASDIRGIQMAGLFNYTNGTMNGVQLAGLANVANEGAGFQIAGLLNTAGQIEKGQLAPVNIGGKIRGNQFGLINVCDTIEGVPIGLVNIVKKGYNRMEIGFGDGMRYNLSAKLGSHHLYNIFIVNYRKGDAGGTANGRRSWGLGYGFGTTKLLGSRSLLNLEIVSMHINEGESWTTTLNQLNELRITFDCEIFGNMSIYGGPVLKAMVSKLYDPETNEYGSKIPPRSLVEWETGSIHPANVKLWLGWTAGLRF